MSQIGHNSQTPLLDTVSDPADLRALKEKQLHQLADELRNEVVSTSNRLEVASFDTAGHDPLERQRRQQRINRESIRGEPID